MSVEGPSGLGKTRLLRAIAQLDKPIGGTMTIIEVRELYWIGLDWIVLYCIVLHCIELYHITFYDKM